MKMSIRIGIYLLLLLLLYGRSLFSQEDKDLIQFSGVIVEIDSLKPIPFTKIIIKASGRGTLADYYGYFSFVAHQKDTIVFSALGYKKAQYIIPDTLAGNKYSLIQILRFDTILLNEAVIFPWPTREQFKEVFFNMKVPEDDLARAKKNMDREAIKEQLEYTGMNASTNYKVSQQQYQSRLYWTGQYPPNNLLNPFAWAQFVKLWRDGKLKIRSKKNHTDE